MRTNIRQYLKSQKRTSDDENNDVLLTSADLASHDDVLTEILLKLPVRSLLRSKCVSKHWKSLISDHRFAVARNPNPKSPSGLFLQRIGNVRNVGKVVNGSNFDYEFVSFDGEKNLKPPFKSLTSDRNFDRYVSGMNNRVIVLHSANGLMLCYNLHEYYCEVAKIHKYNASYYVCNPSINQVVKLPNLQGCDWISRRPRGMTLLFDPVRSVHYKVVCVRGHLWSEHLCTIEVYSSETGSWKMCGKPFGNQIDTEFMCGVYWNNAVHWINKKGYVFYFKFDEDCVDKVDIPVRHDHWNVKRHCYPIVESRDCLLFIDVLPPSGLKVDVYDMNRDYSGWSVKYHVDFSQVMNRSPETDAITRALGVGYPGKKFVIHCFVEGEREEDAFFVLEIPGKAVRYYIYSKRFQELCDLKVSPRTSRLSVGDDGFSKVGRWPGAFLFFESLSNV